MCIGLKILLVFFGFAWIIQICCSDIADSCSFHYWRMDWHSAVKACEKDHKQLLCYKSKKEIDDITEAFRLSAFGNAELELWLSGKSCTEPQKMEECLSLHITKSSARVWHFFQENCHEHFPFVCCVKDNDRITTDEVDTSTITYYTNTSRNESSTTLLLDTSSAKPEFCREIRRRGILWPNTPLGQKIDQPCPGNSTGKAHWSCEKNGYGKWNKIGPDLKECRSVEIMNLKEKFNTSSIKETLHLLEDVFRDRDKEIFGPDLADVLSLMTTLPDRFLKVTQAQSSTARWSAVKDMVEKSASIFDRVIELDTTWQDIEEKRRPTVGTDLLSTVDGMGLLLADSMADGIEEQSVIGKNMALQVVRASHGKPMRLPQWTVTSDYSHRGDIILDSGYDDGIDIQQGNISVVYTLYSDLSAVLPFQGKGNSTSQPTKLNSAVVSATVAQNRKPATISGKVRILVEHLVPDANQTACVFWNMQLNKWDTEGCHLDSSNETFSVCVCDHLTNFALLMDYKGVLDKVDQLPFFYITVIGCSLSIVCLAVCVAVFTCYSYNTKHSWGLRYSIHRNLCLTLLIANLVLVLGLDKTDNPRLCAVVAGMLHYFFLSAFSWMLLEGVHIYMLLVVVFASRKSHWEKYYLFGYGFPLIIVAITAIVRPTYYGTDEVCWLSSEKDTIWAFMGPVAFILLANTAALVLAQWKASSISVKDDNTALFKRWLRVTFILFPVLGITWIFGFLYVGKHFEVAGYLFAIFNSLQGFCIFLCHCVMDKKARNMLLASLRKKTSTVNTGSSNTQKKQKNKDSTSEKNQDSIEVETKPDNVKKSFQETCRNNWNKWHKPWTFCFDMPVTKSRDEVNEEPKPIVVQWNNLRDKAVDT